MWLKRAAEAGHADAQFMLAEAYLSGSGVPVDEAEAITWLRASAAQGHASASQRLDAIYRNAGLPAPAGQNNSPR